MIRRFEQIKRHFEKEAAAFDSLFLKVMPGYDRMMDALVGSLPFPGRRRFEAIDLGCGTGNLTLKILEKYPRCRFTCIDMADNMLLMAREKLAGHHVIFRRADIRSYAYGRYDAVTASMVLHHLEKKDKPAFYRRLYRALRPGGVFRAIDIFLGATPRLQRLYTERWKEHMRGNGLSAARAADMLRRHQREDRPVLLTEELEMLKDAGFRGVDVVRKEYNFAVYGGSAGCA